MLVPSGFERTAFGDNRLAGRDSISTHANDFYAYCPRIHDGGGELSLARYLENIENNARCLVFRFSTCTFAANAIYLSMLPAHVIFRFGPIIRKRDTAEGLLSHTRSMEQTSWFGVLCSCDADRSVTGSFTKCIPREQSVNCMSNENREPKRSTRDVAISSRSTLEYPSTSNQLPESTRHKLGMSCFAVSLCLLMTLVLADEAPSDRAIPVLPFDSVSAAIANHEAQSSGVCNLIVHPGFALYEKSARELVRDSASTYGDYPAYIDNLKILTETLKSSDQLTIFALEQRVQEGLATLDAALTPFDGSALIVTRNLSGSVEERVMVNGQEQVQSLALILALLRANGVREIRVAGEFVWYKEHGCLGALAAEFEKEGFIVKGIEGCLYPSNAPTECEDPFLSRLYDDSIAMDDVSDL